MAPPAIPLPYTLFFLYIEPVATLVGAFYAFFLPSTYLNLTHAPSSLGGLLALPTATHVALRQLGNLYLAFALNEALVLRATADVRVWKALLLGLLIADVGHLYSCLPLGLSVYYDVARWNAIDWGNIAFVYCGASARICFLAGVGMGGPKKAKARARKSVKAIKVTADDAVAAVADALPKSPTAAKEPNKAPAQTTRRRKTKSVSG